MPETLVPRRAAPYAVIVPNGGADTAVSTLREWLRSERLLGVGHWALARGSAPAPGRGGGEEAAQQRERSRAASPCVTAPMFSEEPDLPPLCTQALDEPEAALALAQLDAELVRPCTRCELHRHRRQTVFGVGRSRPALVFVGEGPGAEEDRQGLPFVGRAGELLTRMIGAMTLTREQVYICNVVKCRPPENRTPSEPEMRTCAPFLYRQLALLRPEVIIALGRPAAQTLLATRAPITALRGRFHPFPPPALAHLGLPPCRVMPTFHPAYLLRSPDKKRPAWEDLQQVMRLLQIPIPPPGPAR